jgi:low affinity Fe/Cu permease
MRQHLSHFAHLIAFKLASAWSYVAGATLILVWAISGPFFRYSPKWQFVMTAGISIATFLLVLILQHTEFRQTKALQLKLDELLRAVERARTDLVHLEDMPEEKIEHLDEEFEHLQKKAAKRHSSTSD